MSEKTGKLRRHRVLCPRRPSRARVCVCVLSRRESVSTTIRQRSVTVGNGRRSGGGGNDLSALVATTKPEDRLVTAAADYGYGYVTATRFSSEETTVVVVPERSKVASTACAFTTPTAGPDRRVVRDRKFRFRFIIIFFIFSRNGRIRTI